MTVDPYTVAMFVSVMSVAAGVAIGVKAWLDASARKMIEDFERAFPGKCPICSYHRFGWQHGFERDPEPPPHICPEAS